MKLFGIVVVLALSAVASAEKKCAIDGVERIVPDTFNCGSADSFRFPPPFPWLPPLLSTLRPWIPWPRPTTTESPDSGEHEECPADGVKQIAHPESCEKYILCVGGTEIDRRCAPGFHFSRAIRSCVSPDIAKCDVEDSEEDDIEECPDTGVKSISHPDNCEKYVLCVSGQRIKRNCAPGFHFSREVRSCVSPDIAGCKSDKLTCPAEDDLDNLTFLPNLENCSKYYVCFGGDPISLSCAEGLHWSVDKQACTDKKTAGCEKGGDDIEECPETGVKSISHPDNCEKYILCVGGTRIKRNCAPGFHFSREVRGCVSPDIAGCKYSDERTCPKEDDLDNLKFLPNKENCSKYYICFGGEPIPLACGDGMHWSDEMQTCMDKREAGCEKFDDDDIEECPDTGIKSISHPYNCEKYVLCVGGARIKRNCAPGLHFSRKLRNCVQPEDAACDERKLSCPKVDDLDNLKFLPNEENCSKYYVCFGGEPVSLSCADGMHWSVDKQTCVDKREAGCEDFEGDDIEECPEDGIKSISHPDNCEKYILCVGGARIKRNCAPGFHFSRDFRSCVDPDIAGCRSEKLQCPKEDDLDNLKFLPNEENCSKYYVCFGGEPVSLSCADGMHWSVDKQTCVDKREAGCEKFDDKDDVEECPETGIKSISHPYNCEKYVLCVGGARIKRNCAPGLHFSRKLRNCVLPEDAACEARELTCPKVDDLDNLKLLPNPENCSKFYLCFGGEKLPISCGDEMHWSADEQLCMPKSEANCEKVDDDIEECPESGIKQISHPTSCEKYILCIGGSRLKRECAPGFHFSRDFRSCVQPEIANCDSDEEGEEKDESFPCPAKDDLSNLIFLPNKEDCEGFFLCFGGEKVPFSCANGLHWNRKTERCMLASDAGCM